MKKPRSAANPQLPLGDAYYNRNLFADHFLETRIGELPEWHKPEGIEEAFTAIGRLYHEQATAFTDTTNEQQTERGFIRPVLDILWAEEAPGDCYEVQESIHLVDGHRQPDYAFFTSVEKRREAHAKAQTPEYWQDVPCLGDAKRWSASLDKERAADGNPSAQIANYLYRSKTRWGILTNGRVWRLYEQDRSRQGGVYYEVNLETILRTGNIEQFKHFYMFFRRGAFTPGPSGKSFLDMLFQGSIDYATDIGDSLKESVYDALRLLMNGFCKYPGNGLDCTDPATLKLVHDNSLIVLYRLLFILFAEDRELLPCDDEHYEGYSLRTMQRQINAKLRARTPYLPTSTGTWGQLCNLFALIDAGFQIDGRTIIPAYNGGLFSPTRHPEIAYTPQNGTRRWDVGDEHIAQVIDMLAYQRERWDVPGTEDVDYATLAVQHLGAIYEGLLELQPRIAQEPMIEQPGKSGKGPTVEKQADVKERKQIKGQTPRQFAAGDIYLVTDRGERKATGSYYTPGYIVDYIVEHTVGPLVEQAANEAARLAEQFKAKQEQLRRTTSETTSKLLRRELEDLRNGALDAYLSLRVLDPAMGSGHFLVGAADFISFRMDTDPNLPDPPDLGDEQPQAYYKRLVVERCLYGVDLNPLAVELAKLSLWLHTVSRDQALSFLDHRLRCGNSLIGARLREDLMKSPPAPEAKAADSAQLQLGFDDALRSHDLLAFLGTFKRIAEAPGGSAETERQKDEWYRRMDAVRERYRQVANIWLAPYFGVQVTPENYAQALDALRDGPTSERWKQLLAEEWFRQAQDLAKEHRFFNWELEFPEAFFEVEDGKPSWRDESAAGFHAVIGNPPYVTTGALRASAPHAWQAYKTIWLSASHGKFDIYMPFLELSSRLGARSGLILPSKWMRSDAGGPLRGLLSRQRHLSGIVDFGAQQVFQGGGGGGPTTYTCLAFTERGSCASALFIDARAEAGCPPRSQHRKPPEVLGAGPWPRPSQALESAEAIACPLGKAYNMFVGTTTNADSVFILPRARPHGDALTAWSDADGAEIVVEAGICIPFLRGRDITRYGPVSDDTVVICPYRLKAGGGLLAWSEIEEQYPRAAQYLLRHRRVLEDRENGRWRDQADWYCHAYTRNMWMVHTRKLLCPDVSSRPEFTLPASDDYWVLNTVYGVAAEDQSFALEYALALLNSELFHCYIRSNSVPLRGGYIRVTKNFADGFPVRLIDPAHATAADERQRLLVVSQGACQTGDTLLALTTAQGAIGAHAALYGPAGKPELKSDPRWARIIAQADTSFPGREDFVHDLLAMLAQRMIDLNKQKHDIIDRFETDLRGQAAEDSREALQKGKQASTLHKKCPSCRPFVDEASHSTHQLHESLAWSEEAFEDFLRQLVGKVSHLSDLRAIYRTYTDSYRTCVDAIEKTDWLIDQIVYALYGLTEEEIALVEG